MPSKVVSARAAIEKIRSRDTVCTTGFVGTGTPEELIRALERRFVKTGAPFDLSLVFAAAPELFLYATLAEAAQYLGSDGSRWEGGYQNAMGRLMQHAAVAENAGATATVQMGY